VAPDLTRGYYKNLFKFEPRPYCALDEKNFMERDKITKSERCKLEAPFTEEELKKSCF
jgi:hypothetical protein